MRAVAGLGWSRRQVAGGNAGPSSNLTQLATVEVYSLANATWRTLPRSRWLATPRVSPAAVLLRRTLYMIGGFSAALGHLCSVRCPLPTAREPSS